MIVRLLLVRLVGITLIASGLMLVFTQVPGLLRQLPGKLLSLLKRKKGN
jgi:hypothetical protein